MADFFPGTLMVSGGIDLVTVKETMGHANIATTAIYTHVLPSMKRAAADRMDEMVATKLLSIGTGSFQSERELAS